VKLLEELYSGKNDINRVFNIIQEIFRSKKGNKTLSQYYVNFNRVYEELKMLFFISQDVKKMQKQWNHLALLTFLGSLPSEYNPCTSIGVGNSAIDILPETY